MTTIRDAVLSPRSTETNPPELHLETPPPFVRQKACDLPLKQNADKYMFISDVKLTKKIINSFNEFNKRIVNFCLDTFINLNAKDIENKGIDMIWLNLTNKGCLAWTSKNLKLAHEDNWTIIMITKNKNHKWVSDIKPYVKETVCLKQLEKYLLTLDFHDFVDNLNTVYISKVPSKLFSCCGRVQK